MNIRNRVRSSLLRTYISSDLRRRVRALNEARRKLTGKAHVVTAFLQLDDPYSYLLAHYLPELASHYDIELQVCLSEALGGDFDAAPEQRRAYAISDCVRIASELGVPFLDKGQEPPAGQERALLDAIAARIDDDVFADEVLEALEIYWRGDVQAIKRRSELAVQGAGRTVIEASQAMLEKLGHYGSAMLHYGGEWYWGVDRLHYLTDRLDELGVSSAGGPGPQLASIRRVMHTDLPVRPPSKANELPPLELFYSFRSPYSQLALRRVYELADAFGLELVLRPVLPMMMRGTPLPAGKLRYLIRDAKREAEAKGIPFGNAIDPLGKGVERCHAVFEYAKSEKRGREFLLNASELIWSEAVDVSTDIGLRKLTARTGLFWPEVKQALENEDWREAEGADRQLMLSLGAWGVPTICIGDYFVWGQDRIWLLARHIENLCDSGEGILV
jgi:2-hydroxychromene-2-carboxylate isomerase